MRILKNLILIVLLGVLINVSFGKDVETRLLPLPIFGSSPETGFIYGGAGMYLRDSDSSQLIISAGGMHTENSQTNVFLEIDNETQGYSFINKYNYQNWVSKYYGIGNNTKLEDEEVFTRKGYGLSLDISKNISKNLSLGLLASYENYEIDLFEIDEDLLGNRGVGLLGTGVSLSYDTRDRKLNTNSGQYFNYKLVEYFSSRKNNTFLINHIDYRYFISLYELHTLGIHAIFNNYFGDVPFQKLNSLGNAYNMRGFLEGRYLDKNKASVQVEYRYPIYKWISGVAFGGIGEVYDRSFSIDELKNTYGFGLRYNYDKEKGITIRFDMAFNSEDSKVYVNFREAF